MRDIHLKLLALALIVIGVSLCAYKVSKFGLPLKPAADTQVWTVEARVGFEGSGRSAKVALNIPEQPPGFSMLDEDFVSGGFGLATEDRGVNRRALWAGRNVSGKQALYYRAVLSTDREANRERTEPEPTYPQEPDYPDPERAAVYSLLESVRNQSADTASFARELMQRFNDSSPGADVNLLKEGIHTQLQLVEQIQYVLAGARIPSRIVHVLMLSDGLRHGTLHPWIEVYNGERWIAFNPKTAVSGFPPDVLAWYVGDQPVASTEGVGAPQTQFAVTRSSRELIRVAQQRARLLDSSVLEFSLLSLPVSTQNVYKTLLVVPLGVFVVVIMRNIVGVTTFGTFMPILIALAFRETELIWGIILFSTLVTLGVMIRFYLERLKLLLVPRLASVVIIVILLMAGVSVISQKLGVERGLSIALFPMVILAMTIERMSVTWDESGPREALTQGVGSLFVAILGYMVMNQPWFAYLAFTFPELLLVLLAVTLLMGRYTGYRLSELRRFRSSVRR